MTRRDLRPLELLLPNGRAHGTLAVGDARTSALVPRGDADPLPDFAVVEPGAGQRRKAWATRAAADVAGGLSPEGTAVVLAPPVARARIVRSLEHHGFAVVGAFLHLPTFGHTVFVVPLRKQLLLYVLEQLIGRPSWKRSLARFAARGPGLRLLRAAAPSVAIWLRRDGRPVTPDWLDAREAALQLSSNGTNVVVHGFDGGDVPSVVAKVRADQSAVAASPKDVRSSASAAGMSVPTFLRRVELGDLEATVERALPGRPAASLLARAGDEPVLALLEELSAWLERWSRLTGGTQLSPVRLQRETVDRAIALQPLVGGGSDYVDHLRVLSSGSSSGFEVAAHNDLTTWNILVDQGRLAVVDWDEAELAGLPLGDFAYAALDAFTVACDGDRLAAFGRCFGGGAIAEWIAERLQRLERAAELKAETAELCLHACWLRHASNERDRAEGPTPFLDIVREVVRALPARPVAAA